MKFQFDFDRAGYERKVQRFAALQRRDLGEVVRDETRLAILEVVRRTPPLRGRLQPGGRKDGERALANSIRRVFPDLRQLTLYTESDSFHRAVNSGDVATLGNMLKNSKRFHSAAAVPDRNLHQSQRTRYGSVRESAQWQAIGTLSSVDRYIDVARRMVGYARSGWRKGAEKFGAKLEPWVSRHNGQGLANDFTRDTETAMAEVGNGVRYAQKWARRLRIVEFALSLRQKTLEAKIRRLVNRTFTESNKA